MACVELGKVVGKGGSGRDIRVNCCPEAEDQRGTFGGPGHRGQERWDLVREKSHTSSTINMRSDDAITGYVS
jgi:hypothetical protein